MERSRLFAIAIFAAVTSQTPADEFSIKLRDGPGVEVASNNCAACHSLDYIVINSPFPSRATWQAEVEKMIKAYGADISTEDAQSIIDYLAKNYGS
jgi:sulfite dehydrogenase (cytochrome) subunit B